MHYFVVFSSRSIKTFILIAAFFSMPLLAQVGNLSFLKNSLISKLTEKDIRLLKQRAEDVLNRSPDQKVSRWVSPDSKISIQILPKLTYTESQVLCRRTFFRLSASPRTSEVYGFNICRNSEGKWEVSQSRLQALTDEDVSIIKSTLDLLLGNLGKQREMLTWYNERTKVHGTMIGLPVSTDNCAVVMISLFDSYGVSLEGDYHYCRDNNIWVRVQNEEP